MQQDKLGVFYSEMSDTGQTFWKYLICFYKFIWMYHKPENLEYMKVNEL